MRSRTSSRVHFSRALSLVTNMRYQSLNGGALIG
jgi:hypothetical protein